LERDEDEPGKIIRVFSVFLKIRVCVRARACPTCSFPLSLFEALRRRGEAAELHVRHPQRPSRFLFSPATPVTLFWFRAMYVEVSLMVFYGVFWCTQWKIGPSGYNCKSSLVSNPTVLTAGDCVTGCAG
jgi:hypothetical protein